MVVSDPNATKAAAAMSVDVGAASDPVHLPGLAHFLEHMLFLGEQTKTLLVPVFWCIYRYNMLCCCSLSVMMLMVTVRVGRRPFFRLLWSLLLFHKEEEEPAAQKKRK